ncbi:MAG: hypothetical protein ACE5J2_07980 [Nitrososphaerales archaeon]
MRAFELKRGVYPYSIPPEDFLNRPYDSFRDALYTLKKLNKTFPKLSEEYLKSYRGKIKKRIGKLDAAGKKEYQRYSNWFDEFDKETDKSKESSLKITHKELANILNIAYETEDVHTQFGWFLREMSLVYLVARFEDFLKSCLRNVYLLLPESMKMSDKRMSMKEIFSLKSLEDIHGMAIDKQLDDVISKSITDINKYLADNFKLDLSKKTDWKEFKECFYRRNIVIHNDCCVNEWYRRNTGYKGKKQRLPIRRSYLMQVLRLFDEYSKFVWKFFHRKYFRRVVFVDDSK